jgi:hypothetical protein
MTTAPPRPALTETLAKVLEQQGQILKRQQQLALMVDGAIATTARRFDVLHEEAALLRVTLSRPDNDNDQAEPTAVSVAPPDRSRAQKARAGAVGVLRVTSYGTSIAVILRLIGRQFPEYEAAIDGLLGLFGL